MKFIDIRAMLSSFQEKLKMCKVFIKRYRIKGDSFQVSSQFPTMQVCLKYILNFYLDSSQDQFEIIIPSAIINLVIIDGLSQRQLLDFIQRLREKTEKSFEMIVMYFRLHSLCLWRNFKVTPKFSIKTMFQVHKQIIDGLKRQKCPLFQKHIQCIQYLLCYSINCSKYQTSHHAHFDDL